MKTQRLIVDSLTIVLSLVVLTVTYTLFGWFLPLYDKYIIIANIVVGTCFIIYGWLLRRWFIKNDLDKKDKSLIHFLKILLPILVIIIIYVLVVVTVFSEIELLVMISNYLLTIFQILLISVLVGIFAFSFIENNLGLLLFKETIKEQDSELGFGMMRRQMKTLINKQWKYGVIILWFSIMTANILVFLTYPSIPANDVIAQYQYLHFSFPNFVYRFNPETGFYQEFFANVALPSSALLNWKVIQSLISLAFLAMLILLVYLPTLKPAKKNNELAESGSESKNLSQLKEDHIASTDLTVPDLIEAFDDEDTELLTYKVLSPSTTIEYLPPSIIKPQPRRRFSRFINKMKNSDVMPVINLANLNLVLALYIVSIFQRIGIITNVTTDIFQDFYAQLTHLYWAGLAEEISYRFLLFGLPLFIIYGLVYLFILIFSRSLIKDKTDAELSKFTLLIKKRTPTNPLLYLSGRWKKLRVLDIILLLASSFGFGYAHYQFSPAYWGTWKIFQAGVAGIIFGYAFCKYGLHAAVILHTINNFVLGIIITPNLGLILNGGILFVVIILLGTLYMLYLLAKALTVSFKFFNTILKRSQPFIDTSKQK
ncbi:MAG: CPBP family intramembrane metalloprotease [Candidatus Heimdallarchaeota archaeon]|nr:CPBP family intramembrane metalloprotease [Candidatus Heimdallarchaeota archaeon]